MDTYEVCLFTCSSGLSRRALVWTWQGYFQILYSCIEKLLVSLNVKNLVLPATATAESIWTEKFGFIKMTPDEVYILFASLLRVFVVNLGTTSTPKVFDWSILLCCSLANTEGATSRWFYFKGRLCFIKCWPLVQMPKAHHKKEFYLWKLRVCYLFNI